MEAAKVTVTAKRRILKFAEGANPDVDEPIEVIEKEDVLVGEEAVAFLQSLGMGGAENGSN